MFDAHIDHGQLGLRFCPEQWVCLRIADVVHVFRKHDTCPKDGFSVVVHVNQAWPLVAGNLGVFETFNAAQTVFAVAVQKDKDVLWIGLFLIFLFDFEVLIDPLGCAQHAVDMLRSLELSDIAFPERVVRLVEFDLAQNVSQHGCGEIDEVALRTYSDGDVVGIVGRYVHDLKRGVVVVPRLVQPVFLEHGGAQDAFYPNLRHHSQPIRFYSGFEAVVLRKERVWVVGRQLLTDLGARALVVTEQIAQGTLLHSEVGF
eukprot:2793293-Prymnesium_polylepis.1